MKKLRLFLLDDDKMILNSMMKFLQSDFDVQTFTCSSDLLLTLSTGSCDVIVADHYLINERGLDLLNKIKISDNSITTVLFTGYPNENLSNHVKQSKIDLFFTKPIKLQDFISKIKEKSNKNNLEKYEEVV